MIVVRWLLNTFNLSQYFLKNKFQQKKPFLSNPSQSLRLFKLVYITYFQTTPVLLIFICLMLTWKYRSYPPT